MKGMNSLFLLGAALLIAGCQLSHPGSSSLTFIEIRGVPMERIREAVIQVFAEESYTVALPGRSRIFFTREGTLNDRLQYGRYEESLTMRVEVSLGTYEDAVLVRLDAYAVRGGSDRGAIPVSRIVRRPYKQLLERVKEKAEAPLSNEFSDPKKSTPNEVKQ